jgi:hypothetical protein
LTQEILLTPPPPNAVAGSRKLVSPRVSVAVPRASMEISMNS